MVVRSVSVGERIILLFVFICYYPVRIFVIGRGLAREICEQRSMNIMLVDQVTESEHTEQIGCKEENRCGGRHWCKGCQTEPFNMNRAPGRGELLYSIAKTSQSS